MVQKQPQEEDDFGDFEAAPALVPAFDSATSAAWKPSPSDVTTLSAPLPLELFEADHIEAAPAVDIPSSFAANGDQGETLSFRKGDYVWYLQRDRSWAAAQVASVDLSISPPSYGVLVGGTYRETEAFRLQMRILGQPPPSGQSGIGAVTAAVAACADGAASRLPSLQPVQLPRRMHAFQSLTQQHQQQSVWPASQLNGWYHPPEAASHSLNLHTSPPPSLPALHAEPIVSTAAHSHPTAAFHSLAHQSAEPGVALLPAAVGSPEDDFGEFESAAMSLATPIPQPPQQRQLAPTRPPLHAAFQQHQQQHQQQQRPTLQSVWQQQVPAQVPGLSLPPAIPQPLQSSGSTCPSPTSMWQRWHQKQQKQQQKQWGSLSQPPSPDRLLLRQQQAQLLFPSHSLPVSPPRHPTPSLPPQTQLQCSAAAGCSTPPRSTTQPQGPSPRRSSPAVDKFQLFLRAVAPRAAERLEAEDAGSVAGGLATSVAEPASPRLGHGVDRAAPLPLDIFGVETQEAAVASAPPPAQPTFTGPWNALTAAAAATPHPTRGQGGEGIEDSFGDFMEAASGQPSPPSRSPSVGDSAAEIHGGEGGCKGLWNLGAAPGSAAVAAVECVLLPLEGGAVGGAGSPGLQPSLEGAGGPPAEERDWCEFGEFEAAASAGQPPGHGNRNKDTVEVATAGVVHLADPAVDGLAAWGAAAVVGGNAPAQEPNSVESVGRDQLTRLHLTPPQQREEEVVSEYGVAWVKLLEAAAVELERGQRLWRQGCSEGCSAALLEHSGFRRYLAALGQVHLAATAVQEAARLLGLLALVSEMQEAWGRCQEAWGAQTPQQQGAGNGMVATADVRQPDEEPDGVGPDPSDAVRATPRPDCSPGSESTATQDQNVAAEQWSFREVVLLCHARVVSPPSGDASGLGGEVEQQDMAEKAPTAVQVAAGLEAQLQELREAAVEAERLPAEEFPRMLQWCEGLDALTLLPLRLLHDLPALHGKAWLKGRPCLAAVANLWAGRLPGVALDLD